MSPSAHEGGLLRAAAGDLLFRLGDVRSGVRQHVDLLSRPELVRGVTRADPHIIWTFNHGYTDTMRAARELLAHVAIGDETALMRTGPAAARTVVTVRERLAETLRDLAAACAAVLEFLVSDARAIERAGGDARDIRARRRLIAVVESRIPAVREAAAAAERLLRLPARAARVETGPTDSK